MGTVTLIETRRKPGPYPAGRRCRERDCITVLTTWNPGPRCHLHSEDHSTFLKYRDTIRLLMDGAA